MNVVYVNHGVANRFEDRIELHKDLPKHQELYEFILSHEKNHTEGQRYTWDDLRLDYFTRTPLHIIKLLFKFMIFKPSTWIQLSPIYPSQNQWYVDRMKTMHLCVIILIILGLMVLI